MDKLPEEIRSALASGHPDVEIYLKGWIHGMSYVLDNAHIDTDDFCDISDLLDLIKEVHDG